MKNIIYGIIFVIIVVLSVTTLKANNTINYQSVLDGVKTNSAMELNPDYDYVLFTNKAMDNSYIVATHNNKLIGSVAVKGSYSHLMYNAPLQQLILENDYDLQICLVNGENNTIKGQVCERYLEIDDIDKIIVANGTIVAKKSGNNIATYISSIDIMLDDVKYDPVSYDNYNLRTKQPEYSNNKKLDKLIAQDKGLKYSNKSVYQLYASDKSSILVESDIDGTPKSVDVIDGVYEHVIVNKKTLVLKDVNSNYVCYKEANGKLDSTACNEFDIKYYNSYEIKQEVYNIKNMYNNNIDQFVVSDTYISNDKKIGTVPIEFLAKQPLYINDGTSIYHFINFDNYKVRNAILTEEY